MSSISTGTPAALRSIRRDLAAGRAGFTLIEALVAMTLLLSFVSVLGPYMFHARRIAENVQGRVAAQTLLRTILSAPFDRFALAKGYREGEADGLRWTITAEPMFIDAMISANGPMLSAPESPKGALKDTAVVERPHWTAFRLVGRVSWGPEQMVASETVRLGANE